MTLYNVEKGDLSVSMGTYATILFVLGMIDQVGNLADAGEDTLLAPARRGAPTETDQVAWQENGDAGQGRNLMMETETLVYVDLFGKPYFVGRLWTRTRKEKDGATFEYDKEWLS